MRMLVLIAVFLGLACAVESRADDYSMTCVTVPGGHIGTAMHPITRCENVEVICYGVGSTTQDAAMSCKFKGTPVEAKKKK